MTKEQFFKFIKKYIIENYELKEMDVELFVGEFQAEIEEFAGEEKARRNKNSYN